MLGDVLESFFDRMGLREKLDEAAVVQTWIALAGADVGAFTDGVWLQGSTLFVRIASPGLRQDLHMERSAWCARLNERLGRPLIEKIIFR